MHPDSIKTAVTELNAEKQKLQWRLNIIENTIKTYQNTLCQHTYANGKTAMVLEVGIRYKFEKCQICGYTLDLRG